MPSAPYTRVHTAPEPAVSGITLEVTPSTGDAMPAVPFTALVWPTQTIPVEGENAERLQVYARDADEFTFDRGAEPIAITADLLFAAIGTQPVLQLGETLILHSADAGGSAPFTLKLRLPDGTTSQEDGLGSASFNQVASMGGQWWYRFEGADGDPGFDGSFFVTFSPTLS